MSDEESEVVKLRRENARLRMEARVYKDLCAKLQQHARDYIKASISNLRGRPGRMHPTMVSMRKLDNTIEMAGDAEATIELMKEAL